MYLVMETRSGNVLAEFADVESAERKRARLVEIDPLAGDQSWSWTTTT